MYIDKLWPHLPTLLLYVLLILQLAAYVTFEEDNQALFVSVSILTVAFFLSSAATARPFRVERGLVVLSVILAYLSVFHFLTPHIYDLLHAHGSATQHIVSIVYNVIWLLIALAVAASFTRNPTRSSPLGLYAAASIGIFLAVLPLEAVLPRQHPIMLFLRFNVSFLMYVAISVGDAAFLVERLYRELAKKSDGAKVSPDSDRQVDISVRRTVTWLPLFVWPIYAQSFFLLAAFVLALALLYVGVVRWQLAARASERAIAGRVPVLVENFVRPGKLKQGGGMNDDIENGYARFTNLRR